MSQRGRPADEVGKARRRGEILDAAGRVFAQNGYPGTDMQAVADAAGVAKGTLYLYYRSKEDLFLAAVDQGVLRMKEHVHAAADAVADPLARIEAAIVAYMNYFKDHPEQVELWVIERAVFRDRQAPAYFRHREAGIEVWRHLLRDLINAGRLRDMPVLRIDDVLSDLLYGAMMANHFSGRDRSPQQQARDVIDVAFLGILSDAERRAQYGVRTMSRSRLLDRVMVVGIVGVGLAAIAGLVVVPHLRGGHGDHAEEKHARPVAEVPVTTAKAALKAVERRVGVVGTLEGFEEVSISPKLEGRVTALYHDVGDVVATGEPLLLLDDTDYRLAAAEAERGLELELARLGLDRLSEKLDFSRVAMVIRPRDMEDNARSVVERARRLGGGRGIGVEDLEKAQTEHRVAQSNRRQAELDALTTMAAARQKKAMLDSALQKRADALLTAPAVSRDRLPPGCPEKGVRYAVASRRVAEGEMVRTNQTELFRLVIDHPLKLVVTVPERHGSEVSNGQPVTLWVEAYPGQEFAGRVTRVSPTVDRLTRSITAEVLVDNADRRLRAGSFAKASVLVRRAEQAVCVPEEAVVRFAGEVKVFAVADGKARAVPVTVGEPLPGAERWVEVSGALKAGDEVVTTGHTTLATGTAVRVR